MLMQSKASHGLQLAHASDALPAWQLLCPIGSTMWQPPCSAARCAAAGVRHRYVYAGLALHACQNGPQQALGRIDVETGEVQSWTRGPRYFVGEPTFVARGTSLGTRHCSCSACCCRSLAAGLREQCV